MNKLILETQISIDGYIADENGGTGWMVWNWGSDWNWDKDLQAYHTSLHKSVTSILISSQMAQEGFNAHWKQVAQDPTDTRFEFSNHIANSKKFVVTRTLTTETEIPGGWQNVTILKDNLEDDISNLKSHNNGNIIVYGGATLVSSLINSNLIDEFHLIINPIALGQGLPIFKKLTNLKMVNSIPFECGIIVNHYKTEI
ncbi:deaminase [Echinicola soli]|uniref:Deaminase n=1 Tax=Echinicola soli TaxID=2591634 RepID=A0A514CKB6_9BACT|nr:dihydrofolate reductase family protein [Echinicola soli]QDH80259.1 deaminase [Echinicola soli]